MFQGLEDALSLPETETDPEGELLSKAKLAAKTLCMNVMILFSCAPPSPLPLSFLPHLPACLPYTTRDDGKLAFLFAGKGVRVVTSRSQSHRWGLAGKISRAIRGSLIRLYTVNPLPDVSPLRKKNLFALHETQAKSCFWWIASECSFDQGNFGGKVS